MNEIKVGLLGLGTIGTGVAKLLMTNADLIAAKVGARITLKKIADLDITTDRGIALPADILTTNADEVLTDPEISVVIELIGGYEPAKRFVLKAIENGKHVVTANKALLALHGEEIYPAAARKGVEVLFEAAVGGGIPVISAIRGNMAANNFSTVFGILNGTCNYILTRMTKEGVDFADVLKKAQELGYAEADPTFDIEGVDTAHKLALLVSLCFGTRVTFSDIHTEGISSLSSVDIKFARDFGYKIKLLAIGKRDGDRVEARVHPTMIPVNNPLADVDGAFNAIRFTGDFIGPVMFYGRGAGMDPTASAVVGDIIEVSRNIVAGIGRRCAPLGYCDEAVATLPLKPMGEIESKYYIRFSAVDRPGVLARISGILGKYDISIESMVQSGRMAGEEVPIVIMTHEARESDVRTALDEIDTFDIITQKSQVIRIEDNLE
ncbi:homoserine dehydrogenase [Geobacter metallireducens RCH3]|uniref:Homoserine dehydrogenase n=1 Tax=Geobacter metallireducens (strain ATCC 53774 / DSM 7210 / GS-15) TaxID=269799 RepID=Q39V64_GEOMG|nr:homoserine dehydrogenase [Geobacter metallireducens]ABB31860.1 homoserine dehydrogenase [Geobacter metallireducens GS-15]EHP89256.1 homoserine dehydrogenase [Geobacter metallireducens RCH3]